MLGFSIKGASATSRSKFGKVSNVFAIDDVHCDGSESHIRLCPHTSRENCGSSEGAGVICGPKSDTERVIHDILYIKTITITIFKVLLHSDKGYEYYKVAVSKGTKLTEGKVIMLRVNSKNLPFS